MHKDTSHIIPVNIVHGSQEADKMQTSWGKKKVQSDAKFRLPDTKNIYRLSKWC